MTSKFYSGAWLVVFMIACQVDQPLPLIQSYELLWQSNLAERYGQFETLPHKVHVFSHIFANPSGEVSVIHRKEGSYDESYITLLNAEGDFVSDVVLPGEYVLSVQSNTEGYMQSFSLRSEGENNYTIKTWGENLSYSTTATIPQPAYYHQMFLHGSALYEISWNSEQNNFQLIKKTFNNEVLWSQPFSTYQLEGHGNLLFYKNSPDLLIFKSTHDYQNVIINRVSGQYGRPVWHKNLALQDYGMAAIPQIQTIQGDGILLFSKFNYLRLDATGGVYAYGRLGNSQSIPENNILAVLSEADGGFLLVSSFTEAEGWFGFRILKTDRRLNAGWMGNFKQSTPGYLSGYARYGNNLILLTSNGYVYALKPGS